MLKKVTGKTAVPATLNFKTTSCLKTNKNQARGFPGYDSGRAGMTTSRYRYSFRGDEHILKVDLYNAQTTKIHSLLLSIQEAQAW